MKTPNTHWPQLLAIACCLMGSVVNGFAQQQEVENLELAPERLKSQFQATVQPFLKNNCYRCHGEKKQKSGVRVDILDGSLDDKQLFLLKHVLEQLKDEAMPPEDERQPGTDERKVVIDWITHALQAGEQKVRAKNGTVRRLTVAQYHNTLRDLLGVEDRLADALPADGVSEEGFQNHADTLLLTPGMMETYFEIAEKALDLCLVDEAAKPRIQCFRVELGSGINEEPIAETIQLNGPALLPKTNFQVRQSVPDKPFAFDPLAMQTRFRFIEGYKGNSTVRAWKEFEGLYHSVFVGMIGSHTKGGYNYGRSSHMVPEGLLLRPRSPETERNGSRPSRGPAPTISMPMRELPKSGTLQITVEAARYDDGLQPHALAPESEQCIELDISGGKEATLEIPAAGVYQLDVVLDGSPRNDVMIADIGKRTFSKRLKAPYATKPDGTVSIPLLVARFPIGSCALKVRNGNGENLRLALMTPVPEESASGQQFAAFEKRVPHLSIHKGLRTDVGARLSLFAEPKPVASATVERYSFHAPVSGFASPDTEEDNANYLAGLHEIGIRSEPTDGRQIPRVLVSAIEFEGPYYETWPPKAHREIFIDSPRKDDPPAYAREVIERFAARAFRRPASDQELASLLAVWHESYERTQDFQRSVRNSLLVVLTSPQFLFLTEASSGPEAEPLSAHELAAKLSYFLWNTTPDEQLRSLAASGKLRAALASEVDRLVADERFAQFADEFVSQWLSLDKFDVVNINHGKFPRLNRETKRELRKEPIHFVTHLIRANLPVRNLIDSDFIVASAVVEEYYGIDSRTEQGFAFVPVRHGSETLGGVLTQAAVLSGLSNGSESNPVKRGAWLARKIIAEPPEPPPPNVPELPEGKEAKGKTLRERLEQHRNQAGCAQCHQKIDPWGLPFEQFDAGGLFKKEQVDASTTLPDKTEITHANALKKYLANDRIDQIAYSFLKHLASYAVGRSLTFNEIEYLKREGRKVLAVDGYRMRDCVLFVVESPLFLEK